jgi:exopolysaccharide biosynthesis polyprenyl glycosylphosphotransferase
MNRPFRVFVPAGTLTLLISEILLVSAAFVLASYLELGVDPTVFLLYDGGLERIFLVLLSILMGMYFRDLYAQIRVKSRVVLLQQLCLVIGIAFLMQGLISYFAPSLKMPFRLMLLGSGMALVAILGWRILFSALAPQMAPRDRLLLVGDLPLLEDVGSFVEAHPDAGLLVAGYVDDFIPPGTPLPGGQSLGPLSSLREIVRTTHPHRVVVGVSERRNRMLVNELLELRAAGQVIEEVNGAYERVCGRVCLGGLQPSQLIYSGELNPNARTFFYQTLWNMLLAAIAILVTSPVLLLTALVVRLSSSGPVLWRQIRVGLDGAPFMLYRFRCMRAGAEPLAGRLGASGAGALLDYERQHGQSCVAGGYIESAWAARDDFRLTRAGRIIRRLRFDQLPQLFNVLKGEMSIAGPSPERPEFVDALSAQIPCYRQRNCVRPGITGWAQIRPGQGDTPEDTVAKLEYDLYYIKNMSLALDTFIIFHTLKGILLSGGVQ